MECSLDRFDPFDAINFLFDDDRASYAGLSTRFSMGQRKHSGVIDFAEQLQAVYKFICSSENQQSLRALACGILFGPGFILVNTNRAKTLFLRSKSGMNNCFQKLGYDVMRPSNQIVDLFESLMPQIDQRVFQIKQWCVRVETKSCKITFPSHIPAEIADRFEKERIPVRPVTFPLDVRLLLTRKPAHDAFAVREMSQLLTEVI
jgi:hypothetical protein